MGARKTKQKGNKEQGGISEMDRGALVDALTKR